MDNLIVMLIAVPMFYDRKAPDQILYTKTRLLIKSCVFTNFFILATRRIPGTGTLSKLAE